MCQGKVCTDANADMMQDDTNNDDGQFMIVYGSLVDKPNEPKSTFLAKKKSTHFTKKHFWSRKKALSKHYFINKKQQESTYNYSACSLSV